MTNLEWLRSLSVEELSNIFFDSKCNRCAYQKRNDCPTNEEGHYDCKGGFQKWCNAIHIPEIKPCPFCGAEGDFINHDSSVFWVQCMNCGAHGRQCRTKRGAIKAWNRRVNNGD